jgi:hypothetical protein
MTRDAIYAKLIDVYPRAFRREFGEDMMDACRALSRDTRSPLKFWSIVLLDVWRSALREHLDAWTCGRGRLALNWISACTFGALASGATVWALIGALTDSVAISVPTGVWGALIGAVLAGIQSLVLRRFIRRRVSWIAATLIAGAVGFPLGYLLVNWSGLNVVRFGYFVGLAFVGSSIGLARGMLVRADRATIRRWIGRNAIAVPAAILAGLACEFLYRAVPWPWPAFIVGFFIFPAVVGLVMGVLTVRPLMTLLSHDDDGVVERTG